MNIKREDKIIKENIIALFKKRDKAIREKDIQDFLQIHLDNISQKQLEEYFSYDEIKSKVLSIEDSGFVEDHIRIVNVREWYQNRDRENAGLPSSFRFTSYCIAKTSWWCSKCGDKPLV
jgi:hypothetical protein